MRVVGVAFLLLVAACNSKPPATDRRLKTMALGDPLSLTTHPAARCGIYPPEDIRLALASLGEQNNFFAMLNDELVSRVPPELKTGLEFTPVEASYAKAYVGTEHGEVRASWQKRPLCRSYFRAHVRQNKLVVTAKLEPFLQQMLAAAQQEAATSWFAASAEEIATALASSLPNGEGTNPVVEQTEACWHLGSERLQAAFELSYRIGDKRFAAVLTRDRLLEVYADQLRATGHIKTYVSNPSTQKFETIEVRGMQGSGYLCSDWFVTTGGESRQVSFDRSLNYAFEPTDPRFEEASVFAYASEWAKFIERIGGKNWYGSQIILDLSLTQGPEYLAPQRSKYKVPTVALAASIRDAGGTVSGLRIDADVIRHELGHHAIYASVRSFSTRESYAVHEGMADILAYMQAGDACLAESICPAGSSPLTCREVAQLSNQRCLRTALNTSKYRELLTSTPIEADGAQYPYAELLSAIFWDTVKATGLSYEDGGRLAYHSIHYLSRTSSFADLFEAWLQADQDLFAGRNRAEFERQIRAREMASFLPGAGG